MLKWMTAWLSWEARVRWSWSLTTASAAGWRHQLWGCKCVGSEQAACRNRMLGDVLDLITDPYLGGK